MFLATLQLLPVTSEEFDVVRRKVEFFVNGQESSSVEVAKDVLEAGPFKCAQGDAIFARVFNVDDGDNLSAPIETESVVVTDTVPPPSPGVVGFRFEEVADEPVVDDPPVVDEPPTPAE